MSTAMKSSNWQDVWPQVLALAGNDESFREALRDDARSAIKVYLNVELPETFPARESVLAMPPKSAEKGLEANVLARYAKEVLADRPPPCFC